VKRQPHLHGGRSGSALAVRVVPRARETAVAGLLSDGTLRIHVAAPAVDDRANQALIEYLAKVLEVPKAGIEIVAGRSGRAKLVSILGVDAPTAQKKLLEHFG